MSAAPKLSEAAFQQRILSLCDWLGLLVFHDTDSRRNRAGFPDLVIVGRGIVFAELKTDTGKLRPEQQQWITALTRATTGTPLVDVRTWRPRDWPEVERVLRGLR